jgi:WD40 repeat protein
VAAFGLLARPRPEPTFLQLTSRKGNLLRARFSPDGSKVYFAATWDGLPTRMFHMAASGGEPTPFGPEFADLLAVGREGQVLLLLKPDAWGSTTSPGTLAILDSGGSEPRPLAPGCLSADLAADGGIAASFLQGTATSRIEWPLGTRRLEHGGTLRDLRFSPDGHRLAYFIRDGRGDTLAVMDARGGVTELLTTAQGTDSLCWTKNGKALLTSLRDHPEANTIALISVDLKGKTRILRTDSTLSVVQDLSSDGRLLWERDLGGSEAAFAGQGLPDLRMPDAVGCITGPFSPDGERFLLVQGSDKGSLTERTTLVREVRRGSTVSLGKVVGLDFSPDSRQVLALDSTKQSLLRIPLGMGLPVPVAVPPAWSRASLASAQFGASGEEVLVLNRAPDGTPNLESLDLRTGATRVLLQGAGAAGILKLARHPSDPSRFTVQQASGVLAALDLRSGESHPLGTTLADHERLVAWGSDGGLVVRQTGTTEISLQRLDPATGARRDWRTIRPADPSGIVRMDGLNFSPDLRSWTFDFVRATDSNLFTVKGLP